MKPNDLNNAIYDKIATEQDKYRDWLKSQSLAEVLNHAYEYSVREHLKQEPKQAAPKAPAHKEKELER